MGVGGSFGKKNLQKSSAKKKFYNTRYGKNIIFKHLKSWSKTLIPNSEPNGDTNLIPNSGHKGISPKNPYPPQNNRPVWRAKKGMIPINLRVPSAELAAFPPLQPSPPLVFNHPEISAAGEKFFEVFANIWRISKMIQPFPPLFSTTL